jgi:uncharacterized protein (DUF3820 family)
MATYTDESLMPFGKYRGVKLANVPASYLIFLSHIKDLEIGLKIYIKENMDVFEKEMKK